jgi:hypothetical protein
VCVCVCASECEREGGESVCVCVCVFINEYLYIGEESEGSWRQLAQREIRRQIAA